MPGKIFIVAEAGVNHNGSVKTAKSLIDAAAGSGADAIKFQTFKAELCVSYQAPKARYQKDSLKDCQSQLEMLKALELGEGSHRELIKYCRGKGIIFLSSPFDIESVNLLAKLGLKIIKIPSGEITNLPFLRKIGALNKKIFMSTGMAVLKEVSEALNILVYSGTEKKNITILHCTTEYPAPIIDVNLRAMLTMREELQVDVGYSDHTPGVEVAVAAAALGARVIEKHFTLDKNMPGPDHKASLNPREFKLMSYFIRNVEKALGDGVKKPMASELKNMRVVRKSIVAANPIKKGELFTENNITVKRPGAGISPMFWDELLGSEAKNNFKKDEPVKI